LLCIFSGATIYNLLGEIVYSYPGIEVIPGNYQYFWNGKTQDGKNLPSGEYLAVLKTSKDKYCRKMIISK